MSKHEAFGEALGRFQPCRISGWSKDTQSGRLKYVDNTCGENVVGAHYGEVDTFFLSENENPGQVGQLQADVSRYALRSRIPGENDNFLNAGGLANLPSERVLAAAAPNDQNFHGTRHWRGRASDR